MSLFRQIRAMTAMNLKSVPDRLGSSCVIVIGIAGVVGVLVSVLGMALSLSATILATGNPVRAIVLSEGANTEISSVLSVADTLTIIDKPGVARSADGETLATVDLVTAVNLTKRIDGSSAGITLRGMSEQALGVRPEIELIDGRIYRTGLREIIVGKAAQEQYEELDVGDRVKLRNDEWTVVGTFVTGDAFESSILTDVGTLLSAIQRTGGSSVTVRLESEAAFETFSDAVSTDPALSVDVMREPQYYASQSNQIRGILTAVSYFVGGIMAVGALFAALNTMYSAVSSRSIEIATLRAIGFGSSGVVVSVLTEALLLALIGAALGAGVAWLLFGGNTINMGSNLASMIFELEVTPRLLAIGVVWACGVGFLGGLFPALRAARLPVATALRAS